MKRSARDLLLWLAGLLLIGVGLLLLKTVSEPQGALMVLPYVCIGVGCGLFGHASGNLVRRMALKNSPELQRELEIQAKDERNRAIADRAKGKAYDAMIFIFGALMLCFALMGVDLVAVLLLVFAYLLVVGLAVYYRMALEKEM